MENTQKTENLENGKNLGSEDKFVIEYPLNYEEIVNRKLRIFEREYEETMKCEIKNTNNKYQGNDEKKMDLMLQSDSEDENEFGYSNNLNGTNEEFYEQIDQNTYTCLDEDEGFVEVEEEEEKMTIKDKVVLNENEHRSNLKDENNLMDGIQFVNDDKLSNQDIIIENKVKNPEKIKNAMRGINMKPPKWAEKYVIILEIFNF